MKNRLRLLWTLLFLSLGSGIIIYAHSPKNIMSFIDIGTHHIPSHSLEVYQHQTVSQSFVPNFDNLNGISIFIPKQDLDKSEKVVFSIIQNKRSIASLDMTKRNLHPPDNDFFAIPPDAEKTSSGFHFHFRFPSIENSKGKTFVFQLVAPDLSKEFGLKIGYWPQRNNSGYYEALTEGKLFINSQKQLGSLAFRTYHTTNATFLMTLKEIKIRLLNDKAFLIVFTACLVLLFLLIMKSVVSAKPWMNSKSSFRHMR